MGEVVGVWGQTGSPLKGLLPKWHGPFQTRLTHSVIPSEVEESLILTITSSKRCLDCARHDKKPIWATRPLDLTPTPSRRLGPAIQRAKCGAFSQNVHRKRYLLD